MKARAHQATGHSRLRGLVLSKQKTQYMDLVLPGSETWSCGQEHFVLYRCCLQYFLPSQDVWTLQSQWTTDQFSLQYCHLPYHLKNFICNLSHLPMLYNLRRKKLFLPSVMQNTRRKARSWAEMGGSVKCNAKTLDLKTTKSEVRPTVPPEEDARALTQQS